MPLYSSRSKKDRKNGRSRTSSTSVVSMASRSTKGSQTSTEKPKTDSIEAHMTKTGASSPKSLDSKSASTDAEKKAPNVFEYLDENDTTTSTSSEEDDEVPPKPAANAASKVSYASAGRRSNSTTSTTANVNGRSRTSSVRSKGSTEVPDLSPPPAAQLQLARPLVENKHSMDLTTMPEAYYTSSYRNNTAPPFHRPPLPPSPPRSPEEDLHRTTRKPRRSTRSSHSHHNPSGYGLLAWRLSSASEGKEPRLPPLYRRFEDLNHRVLLHLQDEIALMEEDLRVLDEYEQMHRVAAAERDGTKVLPASRRMDAQAQVYSSLHYRREELMGALIHKTEQYNNALSAYSRVLQTLPPASGTDIATYRSWMKENNAIISAESRFLDHSKDLVSLTPGAASTPAPPTITSAYSAIIIASAAILLPLLAFSMIHEFSGRVLVVALVGGAASAIASCYSSGADIVGSQDGWRCAGLYFGFMTISAMFIP